VEALSKSSPELKSDADRKQAEVDEFEHTAHSRFAEYAEEVRAEWLTNFELVKRKIIGTSGTAQRIV
jgi:acyl-CoA thioesterase FadM